MSPTNANSYAALDITFLSGFKQLITGVTHISGYSLHHILADAISYNMNLEVAVLNFVISLHIYLIFRVNRS